MTARYHHFTSSIVNLDLPEGSRVVFGMGTSIVANLNDSIRALRDEDEWVWIVGDDHVFPRNTLTRLLDRELDMVVPLCARRGPPFPLVHFGEPIAEDSPYRRVLQYEFIHDDEPLELQATGSLMLVRREVLDAVRDPWFQNSPGRMDEEFDFCAKVRAAGYRIFVDPTVTVGHIDQIVTWPHQAADGTWGLQIDYVGADTRSVFHPGGIRMTEMVAA
jgi:GT2 family glycosyltransferase